MDGPSQSTNPFERDWQHPSPNPAPSYQQQPYRSHPNSPVQSPPTPPLQQPTATASNAWPARLANESTSSLAHGDVRHAWSGTLHHPTDRANQNTWSPIGKDPPGESSAYTVKSWADPNIGMNAYSMSPVLAQDDGYNIDPTKLLLAKPPEKPLSKWEQSRVRGRRCNDWPCAVIFLVLLGVVLFFGIQGLRDLISNPLDICDVLDTSVIDQAAVLPPSPVADEIYDNCLTYIVRGDLRSARGMCLVFAVDELLGFQNPMAANITSSSSKRDHLSVQPVYHAIERRQSSIPPIIQDVFDHCIVFFTNSTSTAPQQCWQYAFSKLTTLVNGGLAPSLIQLFDSCLLPALQGSNRTLFSCADYATGILGSRLNAPQLGTIVSNCTSDVVSAIHNQTTTPQSAQQCVQTALAAAGVNSTTIQSAFSSCITPVLNLAQKPSQLPQTISSCALFGLQQSGSAAALSVYQGCIQTFLNGTTLNPLESAAQCADLVVTTILGANSTYSLIVQGVTHSLTSDAQNILSDQCLSQTIRDFVAHPSFSLSNCLFQGLAKRICRDLEAVAQLPKYLNSFRDLFYQNAPGLIFTSLWVLFVAAFTSTIWLAIVFRFAGFLIRFSVYASLLWLTIIAGLNFAVAEIPGGTLLLIYVALKALWLCIVWHQIGFAVVTVRASLRALKDYQFGPFFLAMLMLVWMSAWCIVFGGAWYQVYKPGYLSETVVPVAGVILVLMFFWTFETWKNVLAVTISNIVSHWYFLSSTHSPYQLVARYPISRALFWSVTTSFGSVCFGSLLVAALKTGHYFYKRGKNSNNPWVKAVVLFIFHWIEWILITFNMYAFVQVGAYRKPYLAAAKDTLKLIQTRGIEMIVNDALVDSVLDNGRWLGALTCAGASVVVGKAGFHLPWILLVFMFFLSLIFGFAFLSIMAVTVEISVATLFVCFAEDPDALRLAQPRLHAKMLKEWKRRFKFLPEFLGHVGEGEEGTERLEKKGWGWWGRKK
ncbi:plasma-membrane choline transporter-domain-containing protein [Endogone sp. FLAS-F59071]|nr:plasma-membrane choline transporter-domain-containing protein [Endogone sp. FLAS-F59071]|eukprot:RUS20969.1 plasma-membrane choline transporter-domain-containing protein [Endogone sp. FLAS-F59071]